jgi:hypothetical protein
MGKHFYPLFLVGEGELMAAVLALEAFAAVAVELPVLQLFDQPAAAP